MSILSRFTSIIRANMHHYMSKGSNPEKQLKKILRELRLDLGTVQSEYLAREADVKRARRAADACEAEIRKLQRYKERVRDKDERKLQFYSLEQEDLEASKLELIADYNRLAVEARQLKLLEEKLAMDIHTLEKEKESIRGKTAILNQQQQINDHMTSVTPGFTSYEEELTFQLDEAEALTRLRTNAREIESIDEELEHLDKRKQQNKEWNR